ncbi:MAG: bifunctional hydroxymethylpyrimidine kinase/phosphomethylpyrimidine kinase [Rickettsiales bacterium]
MKKYDPILTIAGCDPSGGAGIIADLKTIATLKEYGMGVLTILTAQNTLGVKNAQPVSVDFINEQLDAVLSDVMPSAIKIGMLRTQEIIASVFKKLQEYKVKNIILDPVMVCSARRVLLDEAAIEEMKNSMHLADLVTPNLPEAEILSGVSSSKEEMAEKILALGAKNVLIKGGRDEGEFCEDLLIYNGQKIINKNKKIDTKNIHGTGCTLSAAIATYVGKGLDIPEAYKAARVYVQKAIESGAEYQLGKGRGPVNHCVEAEPGIK